MNADPLDPAVSNPLGATGCSCGAGLSATHPHRCARGHVIQGNTAALVTGEQSVQFWQEQAAARRELAHTVVRDVGSTPEDASVALLLTADSIAQAAILRDAAWARMVEAGGPLSTADRPRRAFLIWLQAVDRLEKHLRLVGLERKAKPLPSAREIMAGHTSRAVPNTPPNGGPRDEEAPE